MLRWFNKFRLEPVRTCTRYHECALVLPGLSQAMITVVSI
jgi:hypothetical protein